MIRKLLCLLGFHGWKPLCNLGYEQGCYKGKACLECDFSTKICQYCKEIKR